MAVDVKEGMNRPQQASVMTILQEISFRYIFRNGKMAEPMPLSLTAKGRRLQICLQIKMEYFGGIPVRLQRVSIS